MNVYGLPKTATIGEIEYTITTDFRDILEIIEYLNDTSRPEYLRWQIAIGLFYDESIPDEYLAQAMEFMAKFISYGDTDGKAGPKLMDWKQDAHFIIGDINKVAGMEVRATKYLHWWTFLSYFYGIGEGQFSTIVSIRSKKAAGKKLEKWEEEFYRKNKEKVDFQKTKTEEDAAIQDYFNKWL
jgi:hypothetical protein